MFLRMSILYYGIVKTYLMDLFFTSAVSFLNSKVVCIIGFESHFLDNIVQGHYANQLKLIVFLPARNKRYYNGLCDKRSIKQFCLYRIAAV